MARKERPVKIKRYGSQRNRNKLAVNKIIRYLRLALVIALIIGTGFLLGKPISKLLSGTKKVKPDLPVTSKEQISSARTGSNSNSESVPADTYDDGVTNPSAVKHRVYYYAESHNLTGAEGIENSIAAAKQAGANCILFDLKDQKGNILYASKNQYGRQLKGDVQIDVTFLVSLCRENGITPVARVYTFMDSLISSIERSTAVMYQGTDTRWLDSSAELGGKAWANPASKIVQQYISDITSEIISLGVKEIVFAGFSTPTGYSLDKRDFGTSMDSVLAEMRTFINTLEGKVSAKGGFCSWQIEYSAVSENGSYAQYIVHPYQLGADNYIITANAAEIDTQTAVNTVKTADSESIKSITLWIHGGDIPRTQVLGYYFVN